MTSYPVFKIDYQPYARVDYTPLLSGAWHLLDFGNGTPGVLSHHGLLACQGYSGRVSAMYRWARRHQRHTQRRTEPAPEHGKDACRVYVRMIDHAAYWTSKGFPAP